MCRVEELLSGSDGKVRGVSLHVRSGSKTTLIRHPIQHLYPLEVRASNGLPSQAVENTEDNTKPEDAVLPYNAEVFENRRTRSNPPRIAAQVARYRLQELALD